ncbi:MAG: helix-turn-helix domain-containing protein, partial [Pseudomonadota bacterium]|nr:helix-turn-helix domain-containing protein [Pseudomonadota bacterium]
LLASPVSMETLQNGDIVDSLHDFPGLPDSFSSGLQEIIFPYLGINHISKFQAAEMTGLSLRTLQRRLANEQTTYSRIYANARLNKAEILLKNTDANLLDITLSLGYQHASTFSRAFHQWTGVSPREYRKQHAG